MRHLQGQSCSLPTRSKWTTIFWENIRAARRKLNSDGPARVRSEGDFECVSIGKSDGDVLRDLLLAEKARTVIKLASPTEVLRSQS